MVVHVNPTFEEWIALWFDYPVTSQQEYWNATEDVDFSIEDRQELIYITQAFENAETIFAPFTNEQVGCGIWAIVSICFDGLLDESIPRAERERCIRSIYTLYEQLFAKRCPSYLSYLETTDSLNPASNTLNGICYMWWDSLPVTGRFTNQHYIDDLFYEVMVKSLELDSESCQEGALHGLGHLLLSHPRREEMQQVIDDFLVRHPEISPEMREYALHARTGIIL